MTKNLEDAGTHCDDYVSSPAGNSCARWFIFIHRLPASLQILAAQMGHTPKLFADYQGARVQVTMASRLGDVGITSRLLTDDNSYDDRVGIDDLSNFSETP